MSNILSISGLSKHYGKIKALTDLNIEVESGQVFGILGPNGSGKTTTLSIILDLLRQDQGTFSWFGQPPSPQIRRRIGSVIESPNFYPYLNAVDNLKINADIKCMDYGDIERVLRLTGLFDRRFSKFRTYSFGMKQRLAIAAAMMGNPDVLILDEPTNGLDPQGIADIRELILQVAAAGTTIILASHLLDEVQKVCTHVAVLKLGHKLFDGEVNEVLEVSDCFELNSNDLDLLEKVIRSFVGYKSSTRHENLLQVYFEGNVDAGAINEHCFGQGVVLTLLHERKRTLEQHFLELLNE